jgi:hypothetical protein
MGWEMRGKTCAHFRRLPYLKVGAAGAIALVCALAPSSSLAGITITPSFDATITNDPNAAAIESTINQAIQTYQNGFSDPINVTIQFKEITSAGLVGQSSWWYYNLSYSTFRNALAADAKTTSDTISLLTLPNTIANPVTGSTGIDLKTANIRALGIPGNFPSGFAGGIDGIIGLNTSITAPPAAPNGNKYSLLATTEHEIDEILGLGSFLPSPGLSSPLPEDLFRYDSTGSRNFTTSGDNAYFSIDGGITDLARFSQNSAGDYGDWWTAGPHTVQVQDAFLTPGATPTLGSELTALDVIGYDLVPEPASASILGIAALGLLIRRRRV